LSEKGILKHHWIQELTRPAFEEWIENDPAAVAVIGIGAIEQHGPHLPLGTDTYDAMELVHEVAKRTNSVAVVPCWPGYSPYHMDFRGTITFKEDTLRGILMDTIGSLADHGVKRFIITNHHGGNSNIYKLAMQMAKRYYGVMVTSPSGPANTELSKKMAESTRGHWDVHSGISETAAALYMFPELVEMERIKAGHPH